MCSTSIFSKNCRVSSIDLYKCKQIDTRGISENRKPLFFELVVALLDGQKLIIKQQ
jgi:hypothetical protein